MSLPGNLFVANNKFRFEFDENTEGIVLGDANAHDLRRLEGTVANLSIDQDDVLRLDVFHLLGEHWIPDQFAFRSRS